MDNISQLSQQNKWKENIKRQNFISHYKLDEQNSLVYARGEGIIPASIEECVNVIFNVEKRLLYDQQIIEAKILQQYNDKLGLMYTKMKTHLVMADRDFVFINGVKANQGKIYVLSTSVENNDYPPINQVVRGHLHIGGWILSEISYNKTHTIHVTCADPKSGLPTYLKISKAQKRAEIVEWIAQMFEKNKKSNNNQN